MFEAFLMVLMSGTPVKSQYLNPVFTELEEDETQAILEEISSGKT